MAKESKVKKVLKHLLTHGSITSWEAIKLYKATRLSAIIFELKKNKRCKIESIKITDKKGVNWVKYKLKK